MGIINGVTGVVVVFVQCGDEEDDDNNDEE